jgi:uncharacterized protein (DUF433 family)
MSCVIVKDVNILGGEPVFRGTRVPFKVLIDYSEGGDTLDRFLEEYPSVSRELAIAAVRKQTRVSFHNSNERARRRVCAKSTKVLPYKARTPMSYGSGSRLVRKAKWGAFWRLRNLNLMC